MGKYMHIVRHLLLTKLNFPKETLSGCVNAELVQSGGGGILRILKQCFKITIFVVYYPVSVVKMKIDN
jgi:hypothetical protein